MSSQETIVFEIAWRNDKPGWHVAGNRIHGARPWFGPQKLQDAISYSAWAAQGHKAVARVTDANGLTTERALKTEGGGFGDAFFDMRLKSEPNS